MYGYLYASYVPEFAWWDSVKALRKVLFAASAVLLQPVGVDIQTAPCLRSITIQTGARRFSRDSTHANIATVARNVIMMCLFSSVHTLLRLTGLA